MENICNLCKGMFPLEDNVFECEFCNKKYEEKEILDTPLLCESCKINITLENTISCERCEVKGCDACIISACHDCIINMCSKCRNNNNINCDCYGKCYTCKKDISRDISGLPCGDCGIWNCKDCKKVDTKCINCGLENSDSDCSF